MELAGLDKINKITNHWFLTEPLYFSIFCTHKLVSNESLSIPIRTGNHEIQFSNKLTSAIDYVDLEELLKIEILRILLKHPYQRQPLFPKRELLTYASNYTINDVCYLRNVLPGTDIWKFPKYLCFEEYYALLENKLNNNSNDSDTNNDEAKLNNENTLQKKEENEQDKRTDNKKSEEELANSNYEENNTENDNSNENRENESKGNEDNKNDKNNVDSETNSSEEENNNTANAKNESNDNSSSNEDQDSDSESNAGTKDSNNTGISNERNPDNINTLGTDYSENAKNAEESDNVIKENNTDSTTSETKSDINNESSSQNQPSSQDIMDRIEQSELWEEDSEFEEQINDIIDFAESSDTWGSISDNLKEIILASKKIKIDYRKMLSFYRTSILSSKRYLTRMKPSRRYDFEAMGSKYALKANLLVAVDVSGSVTSASLAKFFSIINRFFKYGIEKIDVLQFDASIVGDIVSLKKAKKEVSVTGRGGTSFQPAVDYCKDHLEYDGLIYFTDGYAPFPDLKGFNREILWIIDGSEGYNYFTTTYGKKKKNKVTYIPSSE